MSDGSGDPLADGEFDGSVLRDLTDRVREALDRGVRGPESAIGIYPDELVLEADGLVVTARLGDEVLVEHSVEPAAWEAVEPDDPGFDPAHLAAALSLEIADRVDLRQRLVDRRRDRLAARLVDGAEEEVAARLEDAAPDLDWDVTVEVVEFPFEYHHGDPEWVTEQGYPPFGLEVMSWDPDVEVVVAIEGDPPDVDRLVDEAVERLLEEVDGG